MIQGPSGPEPYRRLPEELDDAEPRPAALPAVAQLELVRERLDDRDAEPALGELLLIRCPAAIVEAAPVVGDLDHEPVGTELVDDLDDAVLLGIGVANR